MLNASQKKGGPDYKNFECRTSDAEQVAALALLVAAVAPSLAGADESAGRPPLMTCVAFLSEDDTGPKKSFNNLRMGQCLTSGDAICSSTGSWVFGIDPADRSIKLREGNRVSRFECTCSLT